MVEGIFARNSPLITVRLGWGQAIQNPFFILDTGFTGDLQVTEEIAQDLGLQVTGIMPVGIADGSIVNVKTAIILASMEGVIETLEVLISGSTPLAGISFLSKFNYKAIVDCKNRKVTLKMV